MYAKTKLTFYNVLPFSSGLGLWCVYKSWALEFPDFDCNNWQL